MKRLSCLLVALVFVLTACVDFPSVEVDHPTVKGNPRSGGTIKVGIVQPRTLDPADASDPASQLVVRTMCDSLLLTDPETGELVPGIAEKWVTSTESGGTRVNVTLRKDVKFPDGSTVDARAVVGALSRLAREETAGSMAPLFQSLGGYEEIQGRTEDARGRDREFLNSVRVSDPYGIEIWPVEGEYAGWVRRLANPAAAIVDDEAARADPLAFARQPVCAGPYQLTAPWNPGDPIIRLVRNEHYEGSSWGYTNDGVGYAKEILFYVFETPELAYEAYGEKRVDVVQVPAAEQAAAKSAQAKSYAEGNGHDAVYVGLPWQSGNLFEDQVVRVALSQAINRTGIVKSAYGGGTIPATGFLPPVVGPSYRENACPTEVPSRAKPKLAQETLAQTQTKLRGQSVPLYYFDGYLPNAAVAAAIAKSWKSAFGLQVKPKPLAEEGFLARADGGFDGPFLMGWDGQRYATPESYLVGLAGTGEDGNLSQYSDPVLDRYFEDDLLPYGGRAGDGLATEEEQLLALKRAEARMCELMPVLPVTIAKSHWLVRASKFESARGAVLDRFGDPVLRELWLTKGKG